MAFVPVHKSVKAVGETRAHFAGTCRREHPWNRRVKVENGFVIVNRAALPALPGVGRSYAVNIAHYIYPLQLAFNGARQALDEAKSEVFTRARYNEESREHVLYKDVVVIVYTPRGGGDRTLVPCTLARVTYKTAQDPLKLYLEKVAEPLECVDRLLERLKPLSPDPAFSDSLLYDAEKFSELLSSTAEMELSRKLIEYVLQRNVNAKFRRKVRDLVDEVFGALIEPLSVSTVYECKSEVNKGEKLFVSIVRAARFVREGMRAWG